jgi:c-di-GMP-binding flagellar brake protein YcgR
MSVLAYVNQRAILRHAVRMPCEVVRDRGFRLLGKQAIDLSPEGMQVVLERGADVEPGESVLVSFQATNLGMWFDLEATTSRIVCGRRHLDGGVQTIGLRFREVRPVIRHILRGALRRVPPPLPRREVGMPRFRVDYAATVRRIACA